MDPQPPSPLAQALPRRYYITKPPLSRLPRGCCTTTLCKHAICAKGIRSVKTHTNATAAQYTARLQQAGTVHTPCHQAAHPMPHMLLSRAKGESQKTCIARVKAPSRHCCALSLCGSEGGWASGRRRKDPDTTMECPTQVTASTNSGRKQPCMPRPTHARAVHQLTNLHRQVPSLPSQDPQACRVWLASVGRCADLPASVVLMFIHKMAVSTTVRSSCIAHPPVPSRRPWSSVVKPHPPARPTSAA